MTYLDSISMAANVVLDFGLPDELLPLTITNEAAHLAGFDSDNIGATGWN
jgi:hypothetical protein